MCKSLFPLKYSELTETGWYWTRSVGKSDWFMTEVNRLDVRHGDAAGSDWEYIKVPSPHEICQSLNFPAPTLAELHDAIENCRFNDATVMAKVILNQRSAITESEPKDLSNLGNVNKQEESNKE